MKAYGLADNFGPKFFWSLENSDPWGVQRGQNLAILFW